MVHAQCSLNLLFHILNNPWHGIRDYLFVVDYETTTQCLSLCWIIVDLLLDKIVDVSVVNFDNEDVLGLGLVVDPDFSEGSKAIECKRKREGIVF